MNEVIMPEWFMVEDVYKELTSEKTDLNKKLTKQLDEFTESKKRLVEFYLNGKLTEDMYELKLADYTMAEQDINSNLCNSELSEDDFEKCLNSSIGIIQNLDEAWYNCNLKAKKNLQNLIFPNGLNADFETFQNTEIASIFNKIGALSAPNSNMVPPSKFELLSTP